MNPITPLRTAMLIAMLAALPIAAQTGNPGGRINDRLGEMDYGVCRGTDPACYHDWPRKTAGRVPRAAVHAHARPAPRQPRPGAGRRA